MCGIFGFISLKPIPPSVLVSGLKRLEYRGYDSWGVAVSSSKKIHLTKNVGLISQIKKLNLPNSEIGIAHTRWATTGKVTVNNAHPHFSSDESFCLAQNGIVENFNLIKLRLLKNGFRFTSETDTEVIVRLIEYELLSTSNFKQALKNAFSHLIGRNTIIVLHHPSSTIYAIRNGSPLIIGKNTSLNRIYLSSDTLSLAKVCTEFFTIKNNHLVTVDSNLNLRISCLNSSLPQKFSFSPLKIPDPVISKHGFSHFMLKEILDTPSTLRRLTTQDNQPLKRLANRLKKSRYIFTIGSGTAGISAKIIAQFLNNISGLPVIPLIGADSDSYHKFFSPETTLIAPSQSGETADVLEVLEFAKTKKCTIASFINMPGSQMSQISDFSFQSEAGPEISVASTKVFSSQVNWGFLLAHTTLGTEKTGRRLILKASRQINNYLKNANNLNQIEQLAHQLKNTKSLLLLGKDISLPILNEGMIKIIETSYLHAHALPAGDLKHYAITMVEPQTPIIISVPDPTDTNLINIINETKARGAFIIGLSPTPSSTFDFWLPTPGSDSTFYLTAIIPLQLLAFYLGKALNLPIDKPRNIAKSVTVK